MWLLALSGRLKLGFFGLLKKSRGQLTKTRVTLDGPSDGLSMLGNCVVPLVYEP